MNTNPEGGSHINKLLHVYSHHQTLKRCASENPGIFFIGWNCFELFRARTSRALLASKYVSVRIAILHLVHCIAIICFKARNILCHNLTNSYSQQHRHISYRSSHIKYQYHVIVYYKTNCQGCISVDFTSLHHK